MNVILKCGVTNECDATSDINITKGLHKHKNWRQLTDGYNI